MSKDNLSIRMIQPSRTVWIIFCFCLLLFLTIIFFFYINKFQSFTFSNNKFLLCSLPKIAFYKNIKVKGQEYSLKLVDTAGQDEYSLFPHTYAMDIHGYCLVYRYLSSVDTLYYFKNTFFFFFLLQFSPIITIAGNHYHHDPYSHLIVLFGVYY